MNVKIEFIRNTLADFEGKAICKGYVPCIKGEPIGQSGVTIGTGVDLGQQTEAGLLAMGVPASIVGALLPYLGLKKHDAINKLNALPLTLSFDAVDTLDTAVFLFYLKNISKKIGTLANNSDAFENAPKEVQAVATSLCWHLGINGAPKTLTMLAIGDYKGAIVELETPSAWKNKYMTRRKAEAKILRSMGVANG